MTCEPLLAQPCVAVRDIKLRLRHGQAVYVQTFWRYEQTELRMRKAFARKNVETSHWSAPGLRRITFGLLQAMEANIGHVAHLEADAEAR